MGSESSGRKSWRVAAAAAAAGAFHEGAAHGYGRSAARFSATLSWHAVPCSLTVWSQRCCGAFANGCIAFQVGNFSESRGLQKSEPARFAIVTSVSVVESSAVYLVVGGDSCAL